MVSSYRNLPKYKAPVEIQPGLYILFDE